MTDVETMEDQLLKIEDIYGNLTRHLLSTHIDFKGAKQDILGLRILACRLEIAITNIERLNNDLS